MNVSGGRWLAPAALALALLSIGFNLYLVAQIRSPERWVAPAAARALARLAGPDGTIRHTIGIPAGTPLELDIPVDERFTIRIDTVIPIRTNIRVPVRTPVGSYSAVVPIRADVPLRTVVPLHIRHSFRLRTRTSQEIRIPIEVRVPDVLE